LARAIADARQHAIADGVRPLPGVILRALQGYFPDTLLRKCRFAVSPAGPLKLPAWRLSYGHATAVTLIDVVIFAADRAAQTDLKLWAQALTHVMQYQRWGAEEFARRYVNDRAAIDYEAAANAVRCMSWLRDKDAVART
jgi:hypothetical protein